MNKIFRLIFVFALFFVFGFQNVNACSIEIAPLRKWFRSSDSIFIGKVLRLEKYTPTEEEKRKFVPENWQYFTVFTKVTFEVNKKWKGNLSKTKEFFATSFFVCGCDSKVSQYEIGKEYLVYAEKKNFVTICDSKLISEDWVKKEMKRLDNFGFRLWSRIYPF